jgi:hypothetical protein
MPEIEITPEQEERLRALQEDIARDVVGKYGHVRPRDAVEYLLDRYEDDEERDEAASVVESSSNAHAAEEPTPIDDAPDADEEDAGDAEGTDAATARVVAEEDGDATDGDGDAMLNEMMSLLDTHSDKWGESSGDERYQVDLPDGSTEQVRTKDDVKALLFKHYR